MKNERIEMSRFFKPAKLKLFQALGVYDLGSLVQYMSIADPIQMIESEVFGSTGRPYIKDTRDVIMWCMLILDDHAIRYSQKFTEWRREYVKTPRGKDWLSEVARRKQAAATIGLPFLYAAGGNQTGNPQHKRRNDKQEAELIRAQEFMKYFFTEGRLDVVKTCEHFNFKVQNEGLAAKRLVKYRQLLEQEGLMDDVRRSCGLDEDQMRDMALTTLRETMKEAEKAEFCYVDGKKISRIVPDRYAQVKAADVLGRSFGLKVRSKSPVGGITDMIPNSPEEARSLMIETIARLAKGAKITSSEDLMAVFDLVREKMKLPSKTMTAVM